MLFNSLEFALFLPVVFLLYWLVVNKPLRAQNLLVVAASYVFYGWWDWRFLSLIIFSTLVDYSIGLLMDKEEKQDRRKYLLWASIGVNLGLLGVFKYYNFFLDSFYDLFPALESSLGFSSLEIILPVGISFYTFQTLSYTIDIYRRKLEPTADLVAFAAFVSFFPQLVAGPIERATHLLPQFFAKRNFNYAQAADGMRQILWGFFKKVVIADNCAEYANAIFNNSEDASGSTLVLGAIFFAFQIYGDFSGYSDIAIGTARLFGFDLKKNFATPYFSRDVAEFWRRWHISLSTWFRDYLYIPLGGSREGTATSIKNVFIIFVVSGFWYGANWTFIFWGAFHAACFLPLLLGKRNRQHLEVVAQGKLFPNAKELLQILLTFGLTTIAWVFFRAEDLTHAISYLSGMFSTSLLAVPEFSDRTGGMLTLVLIFILLMVEWFGRESEFAIASSKDWQPGKRYALYYGLALLIVLFAGEPQEFIYFQF